MMLGEKDAIRIVLYFVLPQFYLTSLNERTEIGVTT